MATARARLPREERLGIGVAIAAHVALAAFLMLQDKDETPSVPPERMDVSLATEVSLQSTAPDPSAEPAASYAPTLSETPRPPEEAVEQPAEPVTERVAPPPPPRRVTPERPRPTPTPAPSRRAEQQRPTPAPSPASSRRAEPQRPTPAPSPARSQAAGGSRIGADFLEGASNAEGNRGSPAATFGATEAAALQSAITRELRPHWSAPSGVDVERLVTVVRWQLNRDGALRGQPRCIDQRGINDSNRPQAQLHCERAVRAVQLAAPFSSLPEQFYSQWDDLEWEFDRRL